MDGDAPNGQLFYWLEHLDWAFVTTFHGPVIVGPLVQDGFKVLDCRPGETMVLWSNAGTTQVLPQYSLSLDAADAEWLPAPDYINILEDNRTRTEILPVAPEADAVYYRLIHIAP